MDFSSINSVPMSVTGGTGGASPVKLTCADSPKVDCVMPQYGGPCIHCGFPKAFAHPDFVQDALSMEPSLVVRTSLHQPSGLLSID